MGGELSELGGHFGLRSQLITALKDKIRDVKDFTCSWNVLTFAVHNTCVIFSLSRQFCHLDFEC